MPYLSSHSSQTVVDTLAKSMDSHVPSLVPLDSTLQVQIKIR